jgi:hypothetical protein
MVLFVQKQLESSVIVSLSMPIHLGELLDIISKFFLSAQMCTKPIFANHTSYQLLHVACA